RPHLETIRKCMTLNQGAEPLYRQGKFRAALRQLEEALALADGLPDNPMKSVAVANCLQPLVTVAMRQGDYRRAHDHAARDVRPSLAYAGPDHPLVAKDRVDLATSLIWLGQYEAARRELEQALAVERRALPPGNVYLARCVCSLGQCRLLQGRFDEARAHFTE